MSAPRFVRLGAIAAAAATALVAAFPLWGVAEASTPTSFALAHRDNGDRGDRHDRGDKREHHHDKAKVAATCTLTVPANPLTATGLATPYVLNNGDATCNEANGDTAAFVEATIVDPAGNLSVYRPLVIDAGTEPAAPTVVPALPAGAIVGIWFGFQGDTLRLVGPGAGGCINGLGNSLFGQFAYCNAEAFFTAAAGVTAPPLGTAPDGKPCPTVRDFFVVDQDQSDNVTTVYRVTADGRTAQDNAAGAAVGVPLVNASDNGLLNRKINPALGCANFTAPDLTNGGAPVASLALNEIQARQQAAPVALIPLNDPMALRNGEQSLGKVNLYRLGVGQPLTGRKGASGTVYCQNFMAINPVRTEALKPQLQAATSPEAGVNLFDFLTARYTASLPVLGCAA